MAYLDETGLARVWNKVKTLIPTRTSELTNDSGFLTQHQDISGKQNKLTAGANITIVDDVISATGDSGMHFKKLTCNGGNIYDGETVLTMQQIKDLYNDPNWFIYLEYLNIVFIPAARHLETSSAFEFAGAFQDGGSAYLCRVIINSENVVHYNQIQVEDVDYKLDDFSYFDPDEEGAEKLYTSAVAVYNELIGKQNKLVSGINLKTINNQSLLGSGDIEIGGGSGEPSAYIKSASVGGNTLTLLNKDNSKVEFTPQGGGSGEKIGDWDVIRLPDGYKIATTNNQQSYSFSAAGNIYRSAEKSINLPSGLFTEAPLVWASSRGSTTVFGCSFTATKNAVSGYLFKASGGTASHQVQLLVFGK